MSKQVELDIVTLLVRSVTAQVEAIAEMTTPDGSNAFTTMEWLYRNLAHNCEQKAQFAADFAKEAKQRNPG
jgi:hypothetical protein